MTRDLLDLVKLTIGKNVLSQKEWKTNGEIANAKRDTLDSGM